ncbi:MAG: ArsR family transcriptional regulator [Bacteroidota bacterium]
MLDSIITSKTRVKLLLKFFANSNSSSYLRSLSNEFGESTNAVRVELNKLKKAGLLEASHNGRKVEYKANQGHPFYQELKHIVHKYIGLDRIIESVVNRLGDLKYAFITGDYANGRDTGIIDLVLVGEVDKDELSRLIPKVENKIKRKVRALVLTFLEYRELMLTLRPEEALWLWKVDEVA